MILKFLNKYPYLALFLWGAVLFIPFLGGVHLFDWDEVNFAENAREMLLTGNYQQVQINFQPFWEKPPLFFWLQSLSFSVFGINEFAARFPNAMVGLIVLISVFFIGKKHFNTQFAWLWVLCITGSFTPHLYYKSGIIDPIYNLFIAGTIYQFFLMTIVSNSKQKNLNALFAGLFIGAAIITKGPAALLICLLCVLVYLSFNKFKLFFNFYQFIICALSTLIVSASWFAVELFQNGTQFLWEFILYQIDLFLNPVAGHGQPFWYHPMVLLFGCFPISVFTINMLFKNKLNNLNATQLLLFTWSKILFWVVLILFSIVKTKILHYSSACYLPLTFIASLTIYGYLQKTIFIEKWKIIAVFVLGIFWSIIFTVLPLVDLFKNSLIPFIDDDFAVACLSINANWFGFEFVLGFLYLSIFSLCAFYLWHNQLNKGFYTLFIFASVFFPTYLALVLPKVEQYSQGPAINLIKSINDENCYITTLGYKSYAHFFYGNVKPYKNELARDNNWLKEGKIDKPVYFLLHINDTQNQTNSNMKWIASEGGFMLMKREITAQK